MIGTVQLILGHFPFLSLCGNWPCIIDIFSCQFPVKLLSTFGTDSSTKCTVPRIIFILNCTLDAKPFKLLPCTCGRAMAFAKFQLNPDVLEISESFLKHHTVFPLPLVVSNIYDKATITQRQDFHLVV